MSICLSRKLARFTLAATLAYAGVLLLADASSAATRKLSGTHSEGDIQAACGAAGGSFYGTSTGGNGKYYGCVGSGGTVTCTKGGTCYGDCKNCKSVVSGDVDGILHPPPSAGSKH